MRQDKILIVGDQPVELEMMKDSLDRDGYETVTASHGEEALQLTNQTFDLLLADIVIPHMGGLEPIRAFRELSPTTVPMLITGHASVETAQAALEHGVCDYIIKPFDRHKLCTAVAKALKRNRSV